MHVTMLALRQCWQIQGGSVWFSLLPYLHSAVGRDPPSAFKGVSGHDRITDAVTTTRTRSACSTLHWS